MESRHSFESELVEWTKNKTKTETKHDLWWTLEKNTLLLTEEEEE